MCTYRHSASIADSGDTTHTCGFQGQPQHIACNGPCSLDDYKAPFSQGHNQEHAVLSRSRGIPSTTLRPIRRTRSGQCNTSEMPHFRFWSQVSCLHLCLMHHRFSRRRRPDRVRCAQGLSGQVCADASINHDALNINTISYVCQAVDEARNATKPPNLSIAVFTPRGLGLQQQTLCQTSRS